MSTAAPTFGMDATNRVIRDLSADAERQHGERLCARAGIAAVDRLLDILEERHLKRASIRVRLKPEWRRILEESGLAIPAYVLQARTTVMLHSRLLDWQEELFDAFNPNRTRYVQDEGDDHTTLTGVILPLTPREDRRHGSRFVAEKRTA